MRRFPLPLSAFLLLAVACPTGAHAATVSIGANQTPGDDEPLTVEYLDFKAGKRETNRVTVTQVGTKGFRVVDKRARVRVGRASYHRGCKAAGHTAFCRNKFFFETETGEDPFGTNLVMSLGDRNDTASLAGVRSDETAGPYLSAGAGNDVVRGGPARDEIQGEAGNDRLTGGPEIDEIDGGVGNDVLVADGTTVAGSADRLLGGTGDDVLDARDATRGPAKTLDCGAGSDTIVAQTDSSITASCEQAAYLVLTGSDRARDQVRHDTLMPTAPVASAPNGDPVFEVPCPGPAAGQTAVACNGAVTIEGPAGGEVLGTGTFALAPGQRDRVTVAMTGDGAAALAAKQPVVVHVTADLAAGQRADFGWQTVLATP
jgi:Ca2+-binding RTX toxin-like protein